jgi:hypothetical protein
MAKKIHKSATVDAACRELMAQGLPFRIDDTTGRHVKVLFEVRGKKLMWTGSRTTSDHRAAKNARGDVRRMIRKAMEG